MKAIKQAYAIPVPDPGTNPVSLQFPAKIAGQIYTFLFKWMPATVGTQSTWQVFVTLPDSSVRIAGTVPGVYSWMSYPDYGLVITSTLSALGQNDLKNMTLYWIVWA